MANINKQHFLLAGSCAVVLSVFSRSSVGKIGEGIREVNEKENLKKQHIWPTPSPFLKEGVFFTRIPE